MKKIAIITIATVVLVSASILTYSRGYFGFGIKQCPEAWYDNQMPGPSASGDRQYLIVEGERRELREFNMKWIQKNCTVNEPDIVS